MIRNNTITHNSARYGGGLRYCEAAIQNNIIAENSADQDGGGV